MKADVELPLTYFSVGHVLTSLKKQLRSKCRPLKKDDSLQAVEEEKARRPEHNGSGAAQLPRICLPTGQDCCRPSMLALYQTKRFKFLGASLLNMVALLCRCLGTASRRCLTA